MEIEILADQKDSYTFSSSNRTKSEADVEMQQCIHASSCRNKLSIRDFERCVLEKTALTISPWVSVV
jgi:hypothetical protein